MAGIDIVNKTNLLLNGPKLYFKIDVNWQEIGMKPETFIKKKSISLFVFAFCFKMEVEKQR